MERHATPLREHMDDIDMDVDIDAAATLIRGRGGVMDGETNRSYV